jgi:hypothetical protein
LITVVSPRPPSAPRVILSKLSRRIDAVDLWIETHPWTAFGCLTLLYAAIVCSLSSVKLLWLDELITLHIARQDSAKAIWSALTQGADPNPPLTHLLVMLSRRAFGEHELALRLPAMVGYWLGMLSVFLFLKRRLTAVWALTGAAMSMAMGAFEYSYESRSYGIFYGLTMLAVYCWARYVDAHRALTRRIALAGMVLSLAAALCANYFSVVAFIPIIGGELTRTFRELSAGRREIHPELWIGLAVAASPLAAFLPLIRRSIAQFAPYAWNKVSLDQVAGSYIEMVETALWPLLALIILALTLTWLRSLCPGCRGALRPAWLRRLADVEPMNRDRSLPPHEAVVVFLLMAYPFLGYFVASIKGGMLSPRFVIPVCFGFAIAGTVACARIFGHLRHAGTVVLFVSLAWIMARESVIGYWYEEQKQSFYKIIERMPEGWLANDPIVVADPLMALTFQHYAPPEMARRAVFPVDFPSVRLTRHDDSPEENLWAGRGKWFTLPILPLAEFQRSAGTYLILASDGNWLVEDLLRHRYPVDRLPINTRASGIGGFTPLSKATPVFFRSVGDRFLQEAGNRIEPIPFDSARNLPGARLAPEQWGSFEEK